MSEENRKTRKRGLITFLFLDYFPFVRDVGITFAKLFATPSAAVNREWNRGELNAKMVSVEIFLGLDRKEEVFEIFATRTNYIEFPMRYLAGGFCLSFIPVFFFLISYCFSRKIFDRGDAWGKKNA